MRVLVFTLGDQTDTDLELDVVFECEPDDIRLTTIELFGPEMITESSRQWPCFGDIDEDRSYHIESRSQFIRYCEMFGLEYDTIEA